MAAIQLQTVINLLDAATDTAVGLDGNDVEDAESISRKRSEVAEISRDLLHLADSLALAEALVREQYWRVKGYGHA